MSEIDRADAITPSAARAIQRRSTHEVIPALERSADARHSEIEDGVSDCTSQTLGSATSLFAGQTEIGAPPGRLVDIGGRKLHVHCTGNGSPTVVLEAGASSFAIDWTLVQAETGRTSRVCSYDRAGLGWSDPGGSGDLGVVPDLHAVLQASGEGPPYVLVGASRGGIYVRLYQVDYPDEVVGMVLVDPAYEERLFTMFGGQPVAIASLTAQQLRTTIAPGPAKTPRRNPQTGAPFDMLPRDLHEIRIELDRRLIASVPESIPYDTAVEISERERSALAKLRDLGIVVKTPLGDRPLVVLTRGVDSSEGLRNAHAQLARISTNARHTVVAGSGHEIHLYQPGVVIQAIRDVLEAARTKKGLP